MSSPEKQSGNRYEVKYEKENDLAINTFKPGNTTLFLGFFVEIC